MKYDRIRDHAESDGPRALPVHFEFTDPEADSVSIAGTFNNWQAGAKPMHPVGNNRWVKEAILPPGTYEYCLVVDGKFRPDPRVNETVPNPYGGRNSVLRVVIQPAKTRWRMMLVRHLASGLVGAAAMVLLQSGLVSVPRFHLSGGASAANGEASAPPGRPATYCANCAKAAAFVVQYHGVNSWFSTTNGHVGHEVTVIQCKDCGHKVSLERQIRNVAQID